MLSGPVKLLGPAVDVYQLYNAIDSGDPSELTDAVTGIALGSVMGIVVGRAAATYSLGALATIGAGVVGGTVGVAISTVVWGLVDEQTKENFGHFLFNIADKSGEWLDSEHYVFGDGGLYSGSIDNIEMGAITYVMRKLFSNFDLDDFYKTISRMDNLTREMDPFGITNMKELGIGDFIVEIETLLLGANLGSQFNQEGELSIYSRMKELSIYLNEHPEQFNLVELGAYPPEHLVSLAQSNIKYLRAIIEGIPFVLSETSDLYSQFSGDYDVSNYSDEFLLDRAEFVSVVLGLRSSPQGSSFTPKNDAT